MAHHCDAVVVTCMDFRLHQKGRDKRNYIAVFIEKLGVDCDLIARAGGVQDLLRPWFGRWFFGRTLLRDIFVSVNLHGIKTLYLINHEDCGAYGKFKFESREEELKQHKSDLYLAKKIIEKKFPGVEVKTHFAFLENREHNWFKIEEV